jgi:hypothetical protein
VKPILIFDSGVGGLSVLRPIRALLPHAKSNVPPIACAGCFHAAGKYEEGAGLVGVCG